MDPKRLKKVEIIRDPAGRYGLEGYSAVINVILHKDYMGVELYFQDRTLIDPDAMKPAYMLVQNMPNVTMTYTYDKISVYTKVGSTFANYNMDSYDEKNYESGLTVEKVPAFTDQANIMVRQMTNDLTLGADYFVNPKHTISYEGKIMKNPLKNNIVHVYQTVNTLQDGSLLASYDTDVEVWSSSLNSYNSVFYEGKINEKNTLESNVVYSDFSGAQSIETMGNVADYEYGQEGSNQKQNFNYYLEYTHSFKDESSFLMGYGYTRESLSSDFNSDYENNSFNTLENRNKLYGYYSKQLGKKVSFQLGIAGESSIRKFEGGANNYFIFLPHVDLKYDFSKNSNIKFKIRSQGNYPTIDQTNPFTTFVDFESVQTGNPNLKPEVTNTFSAPVTLMQAFTVEPYYAYSKNLIITTGELRPDSVFEYNYFNAGQFSNYGLKSNLTIPFGKSLFFQYSLDLYKSTVEFDKYQNTINDWAMSGQFIYYHQKTKTVAGLIYQKNNNKRILAQGYRNQNIDFWSIIIRRPFLNEKLSVMVLYFLPVTWGVNSNQIKYLETDTYQEMSTTDMGFFKNMLMFEISYRFSKGKVLKKDKDIEYIRENENETMF